MLSMLRCIPSLQRGLIDCHGWMASLLFYSIFGSLTIKKSSILKWLLFPPQLQCGNNWFFLLKFYNSLFHSCVELVGNFMLVQGKEQSVLPPVSLRVPHVWSLWFDLKGLPHMLPINRSRSQSRAGSPWSFPGFSYILVYFLCSLLLMIEVHPSWLIRIHKIGLKSVKFDSIWSPVWSHDHGSHSYPLNYMHFSSIFLETINMVGIHIKI